jgi:hypothetical protein
MTSDRTVTVLEAIRSYSPRPVLTTGLKPAAIIVLTARDAESVRRTFRTEMSKFQIRRGELAQHPVAPDDAVEKVTTLAGYPFANIVHASDQLFARNHGKEPGAQLVIGDLVVEKILPSDLKAVKEIWMVCRWWQSCLSSSFWAWGVCAGQQLVEHIDRLIDSVAVALPEKADQRRVAA